MTPGTELILGFILGMLAAGIGFSIWLQVRPLDGFDDIDVEELEKRVATLNAVTERIKGSTAKVADASTDLSEIEPTTEGTQQ